MATNLPSCFSIQFLEQLLKFLVNFTLLKYVKSQGSYGFLITKELIFGFQILDLRTTVPLVSYIRNSLRVWYHASLSTCCQNLEKKLGPPGQFERKRGSNFQGI